MKPLIQTRLKEPPNYIFIDKTLFFPAEGILVIGDLHIGYETMLKAFGLQIPLNLTKEIIEDLKRIFSEIKARKYNINKVIFLGDIKHIFSPEYQEKKEFFQVLNLIEKHVKSKNDIILIKGNHDTFDFSGIKMRNYYINNDIAFLHGHKDFKQVYNKKIKYVVIGHIHPSIRLSDKATKRDAKRAIELVQYCLMQIGLDKETGKIDIDRIATGISASQRSHIVIIKEIINELEGKVGKTIPIDDIIEEAKNRGIDEDKVEEVLEKLKRVGEVFEPRRSFIQKL